MEIFSDLDWSDDARSDSLKTVYERVIADVNGNIVWYTKNAKGKKRLAQWIRVISLILLGLGTIIPVIIDLLPEDMKMPASIASIILALGSGLIVFDRYMGFSSGWMRFLLTEMLLKAKLEAFQFQWLIESANRKNAISDDDLTNTLNRISAFRAEVLKIVQDETQLWVEEFQTNQKALDENFKSVTELTQSGAISIKIEGIENYQGGWDLLMDDNLIESSKGYSTAIRGVLPGFRKLTINAKDADGKIIQTMTEIVTVTPGSHINVKFALPPLSK